MSDAVPQSSLFHRMRYTPLRDAMRGRWTTRLDVEGRMVLAGLPAPARELIRRVVKRTRLWRVERADVADELIAHFADGLEGGQAVEEVIASFGDERRAAKLIRRAKRRNRPLPWHAMIFLRRVVVALVVVYVLLTVRFYMGEPSPPVDRLVEFNRRVAQIPEDQRAWPLYRDAIIAAKLQPIGLPGYADQYVLRARPGDAKWPQMVEWLGRNSGAMEPARLAPSKRAMGLIVTRQRRETDPALVSPWPSPPGPDGPGAPLSQMHTMSLQRLAEALAADAHLAAEQGDVDRALRDIAAVVAIPGHMRDEVETLDQWDGILRYPSEGALATAHYLLEVAADKVTPADLRRLAHTFAEPDTAKELVVLNRNDGYDHIDRLYTDDGSGDGRLTPEGFAYLTRGWGNPFVPESLAVVRAASWVNPEPDKLRKAVARLVVPASPLLVASRREATEAVDRLMAIAEANLEKPRWQADWSEYHQLYRDWRCSAANQLRYAAVEFPAASSAHEEAEEYLGNRDGLLVAIALAMYRREHGGQLPETLDALVPGLLPAMPFDRMTGQPLRYRVVDGNPLVYSVGPDRDDDGGRVPLDQYGRPDPRLASLWSRGREKPADGDWIIYPSPN